MSDVKLSVAEKLKLVDLLAKKRRGKGIDHEAVLDAYLAHGTLKAAAEATGVNTQTFHGRLRTARKILSGG